MKDKKPAVMKQFFIYLAALLFGAALFSCANEAAVSSDDYRPKSIKLVFDVSPFGAVDENDIDTKTHVTPINNYAGYKFYWSANDTVGIFPSGGSQIYFRVDSDGEASGADFDGGAWEPRAGYTFHGYFPFIGNYYLDATKIPVSFLGQKQEGNANSDHFQNYDFMCTPTTSYDEELQDFRFSFKHLITGVLPWVEVPAGHYVGLDLSLDDPLFVTEGEYDLTAENPAIIGKKFTKDFHIDLDITFEQTETLIAYVPLAPLNIAGKTLTITITDESGTNYSYTYSPSRAYVASNIYRLRSSVSFAIGSVSVDPTELNLYVDQTQQLTATVLPENYTNKSVTWSSSDPAVATVNESGEVTAVSVGSATITVTTVEGGLTATCAVTVNPVEVTSVTLDQNTLSLTKGGTATLVATVNPATATNKTVTWSSNDTNVATVDVNGKVTAVGGGSATITATAGGKSATCDVTVSVPVTGVQLNNTSANIIVGETVRLKATVVPDDATNKNVNWTSSKPEVADISAKGAEAKVTGRGVGTSIITVSTEDGNITEECTVIVSAVEVTSVSLDKTTLSLERGASESLSATVLPENATYSTVTWNSSAPDVVYVDNYGLVTALRGGTSLITATAGGHTATCEVTVPSYWGVVGSFNEWTEDIIATENNGVWSALVNLTSSSEFKWRKNSGWDEDYGGTESTWGNPVGEPFPAALHGCNIAISEGYWRLSLDLSGNTPMMMVSTGDGSVLSVSLNKQSTVLTVGQSEALIPKVLPVDATNKNLSWTSSNTSVATVANGVVTAVSAGTAIITVTTEDGGKTATCSVTVNPVSGGNEGVIGGVVD